MIPPAVDADADRQFEAVDLAFSRQSSSYDQADDANVILRDMRRQVYDHVSAYIRPSANILELNAGTGIDAAFFASNGHSVLATDLAEGMGRQILKKIANKRESNLRFQRLSYTQLDALTSEEKFDLVFSNFGGLNCIPDLRAVTRHLPVLLKPGAHVCWVIMPPVCPMEIASCLAGNFRSAFRRFRRNGVPSHVEGAYFKTYYHSLRDIRRSFPAAFTCVRSEGLAALSLQPHQHRMAIEHPGFYKFLRSVDGMVRSSRPFNRWADHIIVTFRYDP